MRVIVESDSLDESRAQAHRAIRQALSDGALEVQGTWQLFAAVDTGRYRASITTREASSEAGTLSFEVYTNLLYPPYVEFGTRYMAAQPAARPAYEMHRLGIIQRLSKSLQNL